MEEKVLAQVADKVVEKIIKTKPEWFHSHEKSDDRQFAAIQTTLEEQNRTMNTIKKGLDEYHENSAPMLEWFQEITIGKKIRLDYMKAISFWGAFIVGLAAVGGILWAIFKFLVFNTKL